MTLRAAGATLGEDGRGRRAAAAQRAAGSGHRANTRAATFGRREILAEVLRQAQSGAERTGPPIFKIPCERKIGGPTRVKLGTGFWRFPCQCDAVSENVFWIVRESLE
jgi:hypothetical protein